MGIVVVGKLQCNGSPIKRKEEEHSTLLLYKQTNKESTVSIFLSLSKQDEDGKFLFEYL